MPEEFAVQLFVRGLTPKLAKHCQGDASGRMFGTLDAAFNYAVMAERIERTPGDAPKSDATKTVAVLSGGARAKQNAGSARGGWPKPMWLNTPHRYSGCRVRAILAAPTRAAMMTGKSPARLGITNHAPGHRPGFAPKGGTPEDFGALIASEAARWRPFVARLGIKVD